MMNNENGRSMVEMLGVLAIIGVLSVAGIAGYSMAMKKYRANEILNVASQAIVLAQTYNQGNGIAENTDVSYDTLGMTSASLPTYVTALKVRRSGDAYTVKVTDTSDSCSTAAQNVSAYTLSCSA